ncbi:MAG: hypothetical protein GY854_32215 [Deltaproteobacteria bacterium]|nr:hypothetical protein [Deltaproteobacteria bacterium]
MKKYGRLRLVTDEKERAVALYHVVYANEGFEEAARALFGLVQKAEQEAPGKDRILYLDIDGHRNSEGGFDADMLELQQEYLVGFLGKYLSEIKAPLVNIKIKNGQQNDIPPELMISAAPLGFSS